MLNNINIEDISLIELKSLVYDESKKIEQAQLNVKILISKIEEKEKNWKRRIKMPTIYSPNKGESVQHIHQTDEERVKYNKQFKEQKAHEKKLKDERFDKISEGRKKKGKGMGGGSGINIEVQKD